MTSRIECAPASSITSRSSPSAMPPCGGAPNDERLEQEAELLGGLLLARCPRTLEHARLQLGVVDAQRAAADLVAVHHEVVGCSSAPRRDRSRCSSTCSSNGRVNGWWFAAQRSSSSSHLNIGKSTTHSVSKPVRSIPSSSARLQAQHAEHLVGDVARVGDHADQVAGLDAERLAQRGHLVLGEELRDRRLTSPSRRERDPRQALGARVDRELVERVDPAAAPVARALGVERLDRAAGRERAGEDLELARREDRRETSTSSMPKRVSGRSEPKRSIASCVRHARQRHGQVVRRPRA